MKYYSNVKEGLLLHVVNRLEDIEGRADIIPETNFIQCATLRMEKGKTFKPHKHIKKERTSKRCRKIGCRKNIPIYRVSRRIFD